MLDHESERFGGENSSERVGDLIWMHGCAMDAQTTFTSSDLAAVLKFVQRVAEVLE